ncbi:MAG TPA: acetoacetate decarboxylase family protein [Acidimicrobiales bacterium]
MLRGTATVDELVGHAATLDSFDTDALELRDVELLQALFEIRVGGRQASLPSGLHPTNPPTFVLQVWNSPDSPWGPFRLAQGRVGCRSGLRPRGFVQGCVCDNPAAVDGLRRRFGFPARLGDVTLLRRYDAVSASASRDGRPVVVLTATDPEPLGNDDVAYTTTVVLAHTPRGLRLVQVDADVAPQRAERLRPRLDVFERGWVHPTVDPYHPVSASIAVADVTLQPLRYVSLPDELAFTGTENIARG